MTKACIGRFAFIHLAGVPLKWRSKFRICYVRVFSTCASSLLSLTDPSTKSSSSLLFAAHLSPSDVPQRSAEWFAIRKDKLTTSTFSSALGFWKGDCRYKLWHEKVFLPDEQLVGTAGRSAMEWGLLNEAVAIERYESITARQVTSYGFAIHKDEQFDWLGASPDGLVGCSPDGGILEVKCPYNKGKPEMALPWKSMPFYYMPQVQGQMEIMDRDWVDLYCWTPNGSTIFRVHRDRDYWELIHGILREFWWENVVPARQARQSGNVEEAKSYVPMLTHGQAKVAFARSCQLAREAKLICKETAGHIETFQR